MKRPFSTNPWVKTGGAGEDADDFAARREAMVQKQIENRGIEDARVLAAMRRVPRHEFVPSVDRDLSYEDRPLPIGCGQTISQPYVVAYMTEALRLPERAHVLEVGTGSAYQAAVLAEIAEQVFSVEIVPELVIRAAELLGRLGYGNVKTAGRDGSDGWPEQAPYDGILVTAAADRIPEALLDQLKPGARLVMPVGPQRQQNLVVVTRTGAGWRKESVMSVCFVPMTGRVGQVEPRGA